MLTFEFTGVRGAMIRQESLTAGMVGKGVKLLFSPEWDTLRKIAVFRAGNVTRDVLDPAGDTVIPAKVLEEPLHKLYVGIYGTNENGTVVIPTVWAEGPMVEEGARPSGDPSTEEENPVWQQIMTNVGDLKELNTNARESLVAAINEAAASGSGSGECSGMPLPETAAAGQFIRVAAVDETGKVTATEAVDAPTLPDAEGVAF